MVNHQPELPKATMGRPVWAAGLASCAALALTLSAPCALPGLAHADEGDPAAAPVAVEAAATEAPAASTDPASTEPAPAEPATSGPAPTAGGEASGGDAPAAASSVRVDASVFSGTATLTGRDAFPGEKLSYVLMPYDEETAAAIIEGDVDFVSELNDHAVVQGMVDGVPQTFAFSGGITFRAEGTYTFAICLDTDETPRLGGVYYDEERAGVVTVHVGDAVPGDGELDYVVEYGTDAESTDFSNAYLATVGQGAVSVQGTVTVDGATPAEGQSYQFAISGPGVAEGTTVTSSGSYFTFSLYPVHSGDTPLFTENAVYDENGGRSESFTYTVTQVGTETSRDVRVTLHDDGQGNLTCMSIEYPQNGLRFDNAAEAPAENAVATFEGTVTLNGRAAAAGEFAFEIVETLEGETSVVTEGRNLEAADGAAAAIDFNGVAYDAPGIYDYMVSQVQGEAEGVFYDGRMYIVHVEVAYDAEGVLRATVSYPDGPIAFKNTYQAAEVPGSGDQPGTGTEEKPGTGTGTDGKDDGKTPGKTDPNKQLAQTGDDTNYAGVIALAAGGAGVATIGGAALLRRRANR